MLLSPRGRAVAAASRRNAAAPRPDRFLGLEGARWRQLGWSAAGAAVGAGIIGLSSRVAAATLTPAFLQLGAGPVASLGLLAMVPVVGPALGALIGGSTLAYCASALLLATTLGTLMAAQDDSSVGLQWGAAHLAVGLALSPLLLATPTVAVALCAVGVAVGLSALLTARLQAGRTTWQGAVWGVTLACAVGPMGAQLALGGSAAAALGHVARVVSSGAILTAAYTAYCQWSRLVSNNTAFLERFMVPQAALEGARLDLEGEPQPTVFGANQALNDAVTACRLHARQGVPLGMFKVLLEGPRGSGKTRVAEAIARALHVPLFAVGEASLSLPGGAAHPSPRCWSSLPRRVSTAAASAARGAVLRRGRQPVPRPRRLPAGHRRRDARHCPVNDPHRTAGLPGPLQGHPAVPRTP